MHLKIPVYLQSDAILLFLQGFPLKTVYVSDFSNGGNLFPDLEQNKQSFNKSQKLISMHRSGKIIPDFFIVKKVINTPDNPDELHARHIIHSL